jgi:hypothetical protein
MKRTLAAICVILLAALVSASPAFAGARWRLSARVAPTQLPLKGEGFITVQAIDAGDVPVSANSPVTIIDVLPAGVSATEVKARKQIASLGTEPWTCTTEAQLVSCTYDTSKEPEKPLQPYEDLEVLVRVSVDTPAAGTLTDTAEVHGGREVNGQGVEGGSLPEQRMQRTVPAAGAPTVFGIEEGGYSLVAESESGETQMQAGAHPFALRTTLDFDQTLESVASLEEGRPKPAAPALVRNLDIGLPPGLLGNVSATAQCSELDFSTIKRNATDLCAPGTAIGVARLTFLEPSSTSYKTVTVPVFNLLPGPGEPARFGFVAYKLQVVLNTAVRTGDQADTPGQGDYGVQVSATNLSELAQVLGSEVTLWGIPGAASHDPSRGWECIRIGNGENTSSEGHCETPETHSESAFLTLPTACAAPLQSIVAGEAWPIKAPGEDGVGQSVRLQDQFQFLTSFTACGLLPFGPTVKEVLPIGETGSVTQQASAPAGLDLDVHAPQQSTLEGEGLGQADVRSASVTLPEGMQVNPSAANGLEACPEDAEEGVQGIGYQGPGSDEDPYSKGSAEYLTPEPPRFSPVPAQCPPGSKIGTVTVHTPLLKNPLHGAVYLAKPAPNGEPGQNPFNSLLALYVVAEEPEAGIRVKLAGEAKLNGQTGQITTIFADTPQVPFEDFEVDLDSGPRASLTTPPLCGSYEPAALFSPWSLPNESSPQPSSEPGAFAISAGPAGAPCQRPLAFAPTFTAGATSTQAGSFTGFSVQLSHPDGDQPITGLTVHLPPGNAAMLSSVTPCPEPQAAQGTCGAQSLIGEATAVSGLGPDPYTVPGGRVYITGPYEGAPFGLSIVTPAVAGPFNLGDVVVRSKIEINPHTAQVTISSSLPTFVQGIGMSPSGIPLALKQIYVNVNRPSFEFNPTNCAPSRIEASLGGAQGASANLSTPFQVAGCQSLPFKTKVAAFAQGKTSKADGASLKLTFASGAGQANVAKTVLVIPSALPARLTTIQKACLASVFEADPATCPEGSDIGTAIVHTPVLERPLTGPIYLVSHGNAAWPDAELVLQGEGITVILDGQTAIKHGVTTSSFQSVPDIPFKTVEATLPEGPHSALTTNLPASAKYSLCGQNLAIPTTLTGQNATVLDQNVKVAVQGCSAVKANKTRELTRAQKLARALVACHKSHKHSHAARASCERKARRTYAPRTRTRKA